MAMTDRPLGGGIGGEHIPALRYGCCGGRNRAEESGGGWKEGMKERVSEYCCSRHSRYGLGLITVP